MTSSLPLAYCTNVHPCRSGADVPRVLDQYAVPVRERCEFEIAAGLWLPAAALADVLATPASATDLRRALDDRRLTCYTLNAFPFGDFHGERVKEQVYLPDWADSRRLEYTTDCARLLAALLSDGVDGSISTLPLGFKHLPQGPDFFDRAIAQLLELARRLERLRAETAAAMHRHLFGAPSFVTGGGELFWGNDRLDAALAWAVQETQAERASHAGPTP